MRIKQLTEKEFKSTFSGKMHDVTYSADEIANIWEYIERLEKEKYYLTDAIIEEGNVEYVYANSENTYCHILVATAKKNIYLTIVANINKKDISGHYLLDLNKEYSISN
jgi:hypothetical protein